MNILVSKLQSVERYFSETKGEFELFALFLRIESVDKWDLLVSAPWVEADKQTGLQEIVIKIQETLTQEELIQLSRIVLIDRANQALDAIHRAINTEHGDTEIQDSNFFGVPIKHAFIITSKRVDVTSSQQPSQNV